MGNWAWPREKRETLTRHALLPRRRRLAHLSDRACARAPAPTDDAAKVRAGANARVLKA